MNKHKRGFTSRRHPELDSGSCCISNQGFTLLEVLVVVIIIAVLAAIAVPQYKHAVLKSRFSAVMPMAKSVADANEVYYLGKNMYALGQEDLDVTPVTAENTSVKLSGEYQNANEDYEYVAAWRTDVPGVRYIQYQKNSPKFASNIHCEADETNEDALWLCEKGLSGTEIPGSINMAEGDYKTFLLAGSIGTDKLPTSLSKLGQTLCGNNNECSYKVDNTTNTVSTQTCGNNISFTYDDGQQYSGTGHQESRYNAQGDLLEQTSTICSTQYHATLNDDCVCVGSGSVYENRFSQDGTLLEINACQRSSDERGCYEVYLNTYIPDGINKGPAHRKSIQKAISCSSGSFDFKTQTCPDGYAFVQVMNRNTAGKMTTSQLCTETACEIYEGNVRKKRETCTNGFNPNTLECNP